MKPDKETRRAALHSFSKAALFACGARPFFCTTAAIFGGISTTTASQSQAGVAGNPEAPPKPQIQRFRRVTTIVGNGRQKPIREKGRVPDVTLSNPFGVQPESDGSLIIASFDTHVIYRLDPNYRTLERIAGTGQIGLGGRDGDFPSSVPLNHPHEVQVGANGDIFIADTSNHRVGKISGDTGRWAPIAGTGEKGFSGDGGAAIDAKFHDAYSIALAEADSSRGSQLMDTLYIADLKNHRIRQVSLDSGKIVTVCGTGERALPKDGGLAIDQPLAGPRSLAVDQENLWIVLREGNSVWRLERTTGRVYHVAGTGKKGFTGDGGDAKEATFAGPKGIAVDPGVALYVADTENHAIRRIDLESGQIETVMGDSGESGFDGDGNEVRSRKLARPHGVCLLPDGDLLVGDSENHRVRLLQR
ncbi:MAG: hypothetical protein ACE361_13960 [Aureliella sp.]